MSDLINIRALDIGDRAEVCYSKYGISNWHETLPSFEAEVVAIYTEGKDRCVAGNDCIAGVFCSPFSAALLESWKSQDKYIVGDNVDFQFHKWVSAVFVKRLSDALLFPDQKCIGCKLPAPHAKPNTGDHFVCQSCQFLGSLCEL